MLGHAAVPNKSEYCASKFALRGFSEALRAELAAKSIDVIWVAPSTTDSEFFDQLVEDQSGGKRLKGMTPQQVANHWCGCHAAGNARKSTFFGWKVARQFAPFLASGLPGRGAPISLGISCKLWGCGLWPHRWGTLDVTH